MTCISFVPVRPSFFSDAKGEHLTDVAGLRLDQLWKKLSKLVGLWNKVPKIFVPAHGELSKQYALKLVDRQCIKIDLGMFGSAAEVRSTCLKEARLLGPKQSPLIFFFGVTPDGSVENILHNFARNSAIGGYEGDPIESFLFQLIAPRTPLALVLKHSDQSVQILEFDDPKEVRKASLTLDSALDPATVTATVS